MPGGGVLYRSYPDGSISALQNFPRPISSLGHFETTNLQSYSLEMPTYPVRPGGPTVLRHKEYHQLSSTNLFLYWIIPTVHVIPEILDIERFNVALSNALSKFPLLAGRLVRPDTPDVPWAIRLTNSGVPVSLIDSDADEIVPTDLCSQTTPCLVEPLNVMGIINTEGESDEPLCRLTITRFTKSNSTSIGVCVSHGLLDGAALILFLQSLSQFYQGLGPVDPSPYYEPEAIEFPTPSNVPSTDLSTVDTPALPPWEHPDRKAMDLVAFRLTAAQLAEIHGTVTKGMEHLMMSRVDVVSGLLARCLSDVGPESKPIDTILHLINHRGMGIYPMNAAVNAILWISIQFQDPKDADARDRILTCAAEMRKMMKRLKDPEFVKDMAAHLARVQSQISWDKKGQDLSTPEGGCMIVNSHWKMGWTRPHFGHPGKVKFYHGHPPSSRYVRIMASNPKLIDGTWISREGDMEVTLYVPPNRGKRFQELFQEYVQNSGVTDPIEFLPVGSMRTHGGEGSNNVA